MFTVVITEKGGEQRRLDFEKAEVTIGRVQGNDIILPKGNVSKRHSRIVLKDGKFIIVDLKSTNGTYVNGRKITSPLVIKNTDKIYIGDFILHVEDGSAVASASPSEPALPAAGPPPAADGGGARRPPPPLPKRRSPSRPAVQGLSPGMAQDEESPPAFGAGGPGMAASPSGDRSPAVGLPSPPMGADGGTPRTGPGVRRGAVRDTLGPDLVDSPMGMGGSAPLPDSDLNDDPIAAARSGAPPDMLGGKGSGLPLAGMAPNVGHAEPPERTKPPTGGAPRAGGAHGGRGNAHQRGASAAAATAAPPRAAAAQDSRRARIIELQKQVHDRLLEYLDLRRMDIDQLADEELWEKTENAICDIVESMDGEGKIPAFVNQDELIKDVLNEALGLGPLEDLLADESVSEIMVNHAEQIYVERNGSIEPTAYSFSSDKAVLGVIERIVAPLGRRIDESSPLVDARLKDGSRVNAIIPPLALKGPALTIRKFRRESFSAEQLVQYGTLSKGMADFLQMCVTARKNIVVSGGTGSGKTTTLNVVSNFIPEGERIVTIEDAAELQLKHTHWVQLESRPANIEGKGEIAIRDLVRNSLRMRPDRVIVGECRGGEAIDMLQAMNTGHDGSLTTAHSNSPRDTLARLETMVLMSGMDLPMRAIREQIASAIDIVVHQMRFGDGSRRVTHVTEISGMEGEVVTMQDIFVFRQEGLDERGRILGRFMPTGFVPRFYEELQRRGIPVNMSIFRE